MMAGLVMGMMVVMLMAMGVAVRMGRFAFGVIVIMMMVLMMIVSALQMDIEFSPRDARFLAAGKVKVIAAYA